MNFLGCHRDPRSAGSNREIEMSNRFMCASCMKKSRAINPAFVFALSCRPARMWQTYAAKNSNYACRFTRGVNVCAQFLGFGVVDGSLDNTSAPSWYSTLRLYIWTHL